MTAGDQIHAQLWKKSRKFNLLALESDNRNLICIHLHTCGIIQRTLSALYIFSIHSLPSDYKRLKRKEKSFAETHIIYFNLRKCTETFP